MKKRFISPTDKIFNHPCYSSSTKETKAAIPRTKIIGENWQDSCGYHLVTKEGLRQYDLDERLEFEADLEEAKKTKSQ